MAKKVIGGAVIGYGGMGGFHANKMQTVDGIRLVGVYDIDPERNKVARERGIKAYDSREELLADKDIDVVVVATPNDFHKEIVIDVLKAGKNAVSEKPVTLSCAELEEMIAASKKYGKLFTVHQNRRWDEDFLTVKKIVDDNVIGRVFRIESKVHGSHGIPEGWRQEKEHGGGMLLDWGVHLLDQMLTLMRGHKLVSVYATFTNITNKECDDGFTCICKFDNDVEWVVEVDTNNFISMPRWYVLGENGSAVVRDWDCSGEIVKVVNFEQYEIVPVHAGAGLTKTMAPRNEDTVKTFPIEKVEADWTEYYKNLIATINGEATIEVTHDQLRQSESLIEAIFRSVETNEVIKF
ncbi:MAG: Gfo/Idh/MocA family oxidoreductase [Clostridiales bacterium]|nr:Gfo/Idh/MocA family oxidoreductase [Clostridiales bacterium]